MAGQLFTKGGVQIQFDLQSSLAQKFNWLNSTTISEHFPTFLIFITSNVSTALMRKMRQPLCRNCWRPHQNEASAETRIEEWLTQLGMQHRKDAPIIHLSSGEHKRFQLIKAFFNPAQILILDYPFIGLDAASRIQLHKIINEIAAKGTTVIMITDAHEISECITHIVHLEDGKMKAFEQKENFDAAATTHHYGHPHFNIGSLPIQRTADHFTTAVKLENVSVEYGDKIILQNINWQINRGEKWLLRGQMVPANQH